MYLTYSAMNDLPVFGSDIQIAYLQIVSLGKNILFVIPSLI